MNNNFQVKTKCIQFLKAIFQLEDKYIVTGYIQALAPRLLELLCEELPKPLLESHLIMFCEAISTIECLVQLAQPNNSNITLNFYKFQRTINTQKQILYYILFIDSVMFIKNNYLLFFRNSNFGNTCTSIDKFSHRYRIEKI